MIFIVFAITMFLVLCVVFVLKVKEADKNTVTYMWQNSVWHDMALDESVYTAFLYDVINYFSYQEDRYFKKSMSKDQRIQYVAENYRLAKAFGYGLYDVPIIHQMESSFNPHEKHGLDEQGMGGIMFMTAKYAYNFCEAYMPAKLWCLVDFKLEKKEDLIDHINALRSSYMILWQQYKVYEGSEMWAVSGYHWGGWLWRPYAMGKEFPVKFVFYSDTGKDERNPKAYYFTWRNMKTAYEQGNFEQGKYIQEKWEKYRNSMKTEEYNYRRVVSRVKTLTKHIKELEQLDTLREDRIKKIEANVKAMERECKEIGKVAGKKGWIKEAVDKFEKKCREIYHGLKEAKK